MSDQVLDEQYLFDVPCGARALSIGRTKLFELIQAGEIETVTIGRRRLIPRDALVAYVDRLRTGSEDKDEPPAHPEATAAKPAINKTAFSKSPRSDKSDTAHKRATT